MESMVLNDLFQGFYQGRRILLTGHTGFKGSWLAFWLRAMGAEVSGLALDPDTEPAHWELLGLDDIQDQRIDLRNSAAVRDIVAHARPEIVFHLAAQPLVRRSYQQPQTTFASNVIGLVNLLEAVRSCASVRVVVNATTDKVYAQRTGAKPYRESDELGGHDPYSTSKACAELVSTCYRDSFFNKRDVRHFRVRLATARAGNVIGGGDWAADRLVPDLVRAGIENRPLRLRNPHAIRPWQHVLEPLSGYLRLAEAMSRHEGLEGAWNFGPDPEGESTVDNLASLFAVGWPTLRVQHDRDLHPHEAAVLRLDCTKAFQQLAWRPVWDIQTTVARTSAWYRRFHESSEISTREDLATYVTDARKKGLGWAA